MSQLKKGVALSYLTIFLTNIVGLLLTPFIVRSLGQAEYGLYTMIGALIGYMTVLDFGLNNSIVRFVAKYRAEGDKEGEENFLAHSFIIYGAISLIIVALGLVLYFNLDNLYSNTLSITELHKAKVMVLILIFNLAVTLPGGAFKGITSGYEEFVLPRVANIIRYIIRSLLIVGLLLLGGDSIGIVVVDTIMNLLMIAVNAYIVFTKLNVKIRLHQFDTVLVRTVFGYSIWIFVFAMVHQLRWQFGQLILGISFSTSVVAIYAIGVTLGNYYGAFSSAISSVFLPRATQMITKEASSKELTKMFTKVSRIILFVLLYIFGGFITAGKDFIDLWVGNDYREAYWMVILIMLGLTLTLSQGFANNLLEAKNKLKFRGILLLSTTIFGVILGSILAKYYQGLGMITGTVVFIFVERFIMISYYKKEINLNMKQYYKEIYPLFISATIIFIISYYLANLLPTDSIKFLIIKVISFSILFILTFKHLITNYERALIVNSLIKMKSLISR